MSQSGNKRKTKGRRKPPVPAAYSVKNSHTSPAKIELAEKRCKALGYRKAGHSFAKIASEMGTALSTVYRWVAEELALIPFEAAKAVLAMELQRLDDYQLAISGKAEKGDQSAIEQCLRIMRHRAQLLGLYPDGKAGVSITAFRDGGGAFAHGGGTSARQMSVQVEFVLPSKKYNGAGSEAGNGADDA